MQIDFDTDKFYLGNLCNRGHDHDGTGKSLRYKSGHHPCLECTRYTYYKNHAHNLEVKKLHRLNNIDKYREYDRGRTKIDRCIEGRKAYHKKYYQKNKIKINAKNHTWYCNNKARHQSNMRIYFKRQRDGNTQLAIGIRLRIRVYEAITNYTKTGKIMVSSKYGIDYKAIIEHLGPHPNTRGIKGKFHIDHIIPLSAFDLNDPEQIKLAFAPGNHQWLRAKDNMVKRNHIEGQLDINTQAQLKAVL